MLPPILCFSNMEWDAPVPTNRQHLMRRFAQRTQVAVVEAPLPLLGSFIGRSRGRQRRHGWRRDGEVWVLQAWDVAPYPLTRRSAALSRLTDTAFRAFVLAQWSRLGWNAPILWLYNADGANLLGAFQERLAVYHCVDDYGALEQFHPYRRGAAYSPVKDEEYLVRSVDLIIATAERLAERWKRLNPHTYLLPNVADTKLFAQALEPGTEHPSLAAIPEPRLGYVGALDAYKLHFELLAGIARLCPDLNIVCAGPVGIGDATKRAALPQAPNIHYCATLPQRELPAFLRGCTICLIPYHLNDYTASVSPLKLYEYLAAGRPVVATPLPALQGEQTPGLFLADPQPEAFVAQIRRTLALSADERVRIARSAHFHSWERRVEEVEGILMDHLARPPLQAMRSQTPPSHQTTPSRFSR